MELTLDFIKEKFATFNDEYFEGKLVTPFFQISRTKFSFGQLCTGTMKGTKKRVYQIRISNYYIRDERDYCNTILHEMIHLYIRQNNLKVKGVQHSGLFMQIAERINSYGWNVTASTSSEGLVKNTTRNTTYNMMAFIETESGKPFMMRYSLTRKTSIIQWLKLQNVPEQNVKWVTSHDSKYDRYPLCKKRVRGYYITQEEFDNL